MDRNELKIKLSLKQKELQTSYTNLSIKAQENATVKIIEYLGEYVKNNILPDTKDFRVIATNELDNGVQGECYYDYDLVAINSLCFQKALSSSKYNEFLRCFDIIIHELRHIWQYLEFWDFSTYTDPNSSWDGYYNHPTEIDARNFAKNSIHNLWDKLINIYNACIDIVKAL